MAGRISNAQENRFILSVGPIHSFSSPGVPVNRVMRLDYFGNSLVQGRTIAVDPQVIPLGSIVYVSGYNWAGLPVGGFVAHATDIGGAIKGNRIDIFLNGSPASVRAFGLQNVKVTLSR